VKGVLSRFRWGESHKKLGKIGLKKLFWKRFKSFFPNISLSPPLKKGF
jgi:hypothetical protein